MPRIFLSYRRSDSQDMTDRISDALRKKFGDENVFQDVEQIPFGIDFRTFIRQEIEKSDVVIVIIGLGWVEAIQAREQKVDDFVRLEIELALQLNKLIIPITTNNAKMPSLTQIPNSIHDLCYKNSAKVRPNPDFHRDILILSEGIESSIKIHNNLMEITRKKSITELDNLKAAWGDAQRLIFQHSHNGNELIANLPNLMEYAKIIGTNGDTIIVVAPTQLYFDKLTIKIRMAWMERALSKILGKTMKLKFVLSGDSNKLDIDLDGDESIEDIPW